MSNITIKNRHYNKIIEYIYVMLFILFIKLIFYIYKIFFSMLPSHVVLYVVLCLTSALIVWLLLKCNICHLANFIFKCRELTGSNIVTSWLFVVYFYCCIFNKVLAALHLYSLNVLKISSNFGQKFCSICISIFFLVKIVSFYNIFKE